MIKIPDSEILICWIPQNLAPREICFPKDQILGAREIELLALPGVKLLPVLIYEIVVYEKDSETGRLLLIGT